MIENDIPYAQTWIDTRRIPENERLYRSLPLGSLGQARGDLTFPLQLRHGLNRDELRIRKRHIMNIDRNIEENNNSVNPQSLDSI